MRFVVSCLALCALCFAAPANAVEIGRAISPLGDLNVVFNHDADGDMFPNYDFSQNVDGFDDGDTIPESFADALGVLIPADMFGLGRRPADNVNNYPFALLDDSLAVFPGDAVGIIKSGDFDGFTTGTVVPPDTDPFFGVVDIVNGFGSDTQSASWTFDISGFSNLSLAVDIAAMGDFEPADEYEFTYSIDGSSPQSIWFATNTLDTSAVVNTMGVFSLDPGTDPAIAALLTYTLESGVERFHDDPLDIDGAYLNNNFQTFTESLVGTGSSLVLTFTATTDGGTEAFAFRNISLTGDAGVDPTFISGDFNGDGFVDAADYTVWRDNLGGSDSLLANGSADGTSSTIDGDDYLLWRSSFGNVAPGSLGLGGSGAVPEPSTLVGAALAMIVGLVARKRLV